VGCSAGDDAGYIACAGFCDKVTANVTPTVKGLAKLQFQSLVVNNLTTQDLSSFTSGGPDASRIHAYGPFPADGAAWNDSRYAVVLPVNGPVSAITTDLGQVFTLCGGGSCQPLAFQGSGDDTYQIDYSVDGHQWTSWVTVPPSGDNNLRTRQINIPTTPQARYVRTYAVSSNNSSNPQYSVSRLQFSALNSYGVPGPRIISTTRPARGPQPKVTSNPFPPVSSSAYNHPWATVLPTKAPPRP
jgi:hypothetical protein